MEKFKEGKSYYGRFMSDYDSIIKITVVKRTAKSIVTAEGKTLRIKTWHDCSTEYVNPLGTYSMSPVITAENDLVKYDK